MQETIIPCDSNWFNASSQLASVFFHALFYHSALAVSNIPIVAYLAMIDFQASRVIINKFSSHALNHQLRQCLALIVIFLITMLYFVNHRVNRRNKLTVIVRTQRTHKAHHARSVG